MNAERRTTMKSFSIISAIIALFASSTVNADSSLKLDPRASADTTAAARAEFYADRGVSKPQKLANLAFASGHVSDGIDDDGTPYKFAYFQQAKEVNNRRGAGTITVITSVSVKDYPDSSSEKDSIMLQRSNETGNRKLYVHILDKGLDGREFVARAVVEEERYGLTQDEGKRRLRLKDDDIKEYYEEMSNELIRGEYSDSMLSQAKEKEERQEAERQAAEQRKKDMVAIEKLFE